MSWHPAEDPTSDATAASPPPSVETVIVPRSRDIGGFMVRRALPVAGRRTVGPFVFLDEMGPAGFGIGEGLDVRPHPHIGLATVTYLFDGAIVHRDSLGSLKTIEPGAVNWMSAGRGIAHSERTGAEQRRTGASLHGLQLWVALPRAHEEDEPFFASHGAAALPVVEDGGLSARVVVGSAFGATSPVAAHWDTLYVDARLAAGARLPVDAVAEERALYLVGGTVEIAGDRFEPGRLLVLRPGDAITVTAVTSARLVLLGGATLDGPRHVWWNFVSSSSERIEQAKADWKAGRFAAVPGESEFIPLPDR
jgi:redox-sensitive bicupin YhaK (pirin superfamily)